MRVANRHNPAYVLTALVLVLPSVSCNQRSPLPKEEIVAPSPVASPSQTAVALFGISLTPPGLFGSAPGTGTAILTLQAPTGGVIVSLSSADPSTATVPQSVTIEEGADRAAFSIATQVVSADRKVPITASAMGTSTSASLDVWAVLPTFFSWFSDPGDPIGRGGYGRLTTISASGNDSSVTIFATGGGNDSWRFAFVPPLNASLRVGRYEGAVRVPSRDASHAGFDIGGRGNSCGTAGGWFEIREFGYASPSNLLRFDAIFEQHCNNAAAALRGEIRFTAGAR